MAPRKTVAEKNPKEAPKVEVVEAEVVSAENVDFRVANLVSRGIPLKKAKAEIAKIKSVPKV